MHHGGAAVEYVAPLKTVGPARPPEVPCPGIVSAVVVAAPVIRLHRRDDPELAEARYILRAAHFDVLDAPATVARSIRPDRRFVPIERLVHRAIADGMGHDRETAAIELDQHVEVFLVRVIRFASEAGFIRIWLQQRSGVALDDAIHEELHDARAHPVTPVAAACLLE